MPGFDEGYKLLTITIITMAMVIGYNNTSTGTEYLMIASSPRFCNSKSNQGRRAWHRPCQLICGKAFVKELCCRHNQSQLSLLKAGYSYHSTAEEVELLNQRFLTRHALSGVHPSFRTVLESGFQGI